ncbi:MAG: hypothetical protein N3A69_11015, partial [Leptospiraceae bacterium]|nr:hypothetical protein [Leptospiraceae bacterium]
MIVNDLKERFYFEGTSKLSESLSEKIHTSIKKGIFFIQEENLTQGHLFEQIHKTPLKKIEQIKIFWDSKFANEFINLENLEKATYIKKLFLFLEDLNVCQLLQEQQTIQVEIKQTKIFVYLSRLGRTLNFGINLEKSAKTLEHYLKRMPILENLALKNLNTLRGYRVFLIHHITAEILGTIQVFRKLGVNALSVIFVKYGGVVPDEYLEALLDEQIQNFFFTGISKEKNSAGKEYYSISRMYSEIPHFYKLQNYLETKDWDFFTAMQFIAGHFFLNFLQEAIQKDEKVLLVEDGGYLTPLLNESIANGRTLHEIMEEFLVPTENTPNENIKNYLNKALLGTIEHTRNGYDRLKKIEEEKFLSFPTFTIALSKEKVMEESKEVAHSILSAIESVLHGQGFILSRRKFLILGANGNIGKFLCKYLEGERLKQSNYPILKVDKTFQTRENFYSSVNEIPKEKLYEIDFILGVIGHSVIHEEIWEDLLLNSKSNNLFVASGSTKTLEFSHLSIFLNTLEKEKKLKDFQIEVSIQNILDPQSQIAQGKIIAIHSRDDKLNLSK